MVRSISKPPDLSCNRVISPAIVSPAIIDIELPKEHEAELRKALMNVGRTVQSMANLVFLGNLGKEVSGELSPREQARARILHEYLEMLQVCFREGCSKLQG